MRLPIPRRCQPQACHLLWKALCGHQVARSIIRAVHAKEVDFAFICPSMCPLAVDANRAEENIAILQAASFHLYALESAVFVDHEVETLVIPWDQHRFACL